MHNVNITLCEFLDIFNFLPGNEERFRSNEPRPNELLPAPLSPEDVVQQAVVGQSWKSNEAQIAADAD
jgi:hypothetical protein